MGLCSMAYCILREDSTIAALDTLATCLEERHSPGMAPEADAGTPGMAPDAGAGPLSGLWCKAQAQTKTESVGEGPDRLNLLVRAHTDT